MYTRKNANSLTSAEKRNFINAVLYLKKQGRYDLYIEWHHHSMMCATPLPSENPHWRYRNTAHRGPSFLPFHRNYILKFERDLHAIDLSIILPYWDWSADGELTDPTTAPLWDEDFLGGSGTIDDGFEVKTGAFAHSSGNWNIPDEFEGPILKRGFGKFVDPFGILIDTLPTKSDIGFLLEEVLYDSAPWNSSPFVLGFRNRLEGWITPSGDHRVKKEGVQLHNRVHVWIGGTMARPVSPADPVFFLHHCFVDKLWSEWQLRLRSYYSDPMNHCHFAHLEPSVGYYLPVEGGPPGHNLLDQMHPPPWDKYAVVRPADMVDHHALGYRYDTEETAKVPARDYEYEAQRAFTV